MGAERLEELLTEIFIDNYILDKKVGVTPLNRGDVEMELNNLAMWDHAKESEIYHSLFVVAEMIEKEGRISESTYSDHKYAINSTARDLTRLRNWASGQSHLCENEDRTGKLASEEQMNRFSIDREYELENIFGTDSSESREGTFFGPKYDAQGNMESLRIFHQSHRAFLRVETAPIDKLILSIESFVKDFRHEPEQFSFEFPLTNREYISKLDEFEEEFGDYFGVERFIVDVGEANFIKIKENPKSFSETMVSIAENSDNPVLADLKYNEGVFTYCVFGEEGFVDVFLKRHLEFEDTTPFDPKKDYGESSYIIPQQYPEFTLPLLVEYYKHKAN